MQTGQNSMSLGKNRENLRQHNLSIALTLLHQSGTIARSHITSVTGLNRSTTLDLVGELVQLGLAVESEAVVVGGVGRPSITVSPNSNVYAFAVNPDVDAITVGLVSFDGTLISKVRYPTPFQADPTKAAQISAKLIHDLAAKLPTDARIAGVGAAIPGQIRVSDGVVRFAPHLNWVEEPFGAKLSQLTGYPVFVDNDATTACTAERIFGAGRGGLDLVFLFAGSGGIGGGVVIDGQQLRGASGYAGELGHIQISSSKEKDFSGLEGTLEALVKRDDLLEVFKLDSATDEELDFEIFHKPDAKARRLLEHQIDSLGRAVGVLATIFNPQSIVLGGFLTSLFAYDTERLFEQTRLSTLKSASEGLLIHTSELGSSAVMLGAAELAFAVLLENPANAKLFKSHKK